MSLITRCPACGTMFKVVPDQLRISEGWVRCGHCTDVFDAAAHLQEDVPPEAQAAPADLPALPRESSDDYPSSLNPEIEEGLSSQAPDSAQFAAEAQALIEHPLDRPFELRRQDSGGLEEEDSDADPPVTSRAKPEPEKRAERASLGDSEADTELEDLSFVQIARRREFWARPVVRVGASLGIVGLCLLLVLQIAMHDRDRLAAAEPALRPWLAGLCEAVGCRLGPPRQIEAIAIDGSSFNKLRTDAYRLSVTLKNQASVAVAMPALELTLTDGQDQPLVRRVLMPAELGTNSGVIGAGTERSISLVLAVTGTGNGNGNGAAARIAGYRLLAFYP